MKRIIWTRFPFATFKKHYFSFGMTRTPTASRCEWLTQIFCQVTNTIMYKSSGLSFLNRHSIKPDFIKDYYFVQTWKREMWWECDNRFQLRHVETRHLTFLRFLSVAALSCSRFSNLHMTLTSRVSTKTEKYFLNIKLISVASTPRKVKFQVSNSFNIASIYPAYLNTRN